MSSKYKFPPDGVVMPITSLNTVAGNPAVASVNTTDYVSNYIYQDGSLKMILLPEGYWQSGHYHYYLKDHLGSNRVVLRDDNTLLERNHYYPSGMRFGESAVSGGSVQPYRHTGHEMQAMHGLNWIDNGARMRSVNLPIFTTPDPLAEKYYSISPYAYCLNNPVKFIDPDGRAPGDFFRTRNAAAKDFGKYYNGKSIIKNKEYFSSIYIIKKGSKVGYTYTAASEGTSDGVKETPSPPDGKTTQARIHTHGKYEEGYDNNYFSNQDKWVYYDHKVDGYVVTPNGTLLNYDVETAKDVVVSTQMPSDPNDPDRRNKIKPVDNTASTNNTTYTNSLPFLICKPNPKPDNQPLPPLKPENIWKFPLTHN